MTPNNEKKKNAILSALKNFVTRNIFIKVVALVFAMILWGYVLTDQKPVRVKTISEVSTSFDGEGELISQGLCVRGDRSQILQEVTVAVRAQITNYAYLNANAINATVSLKNISEARVYNLPVTATVSSSLGVVQTVTPSTVQVEIDLLRNKTVPVTTTFSGELPDGYWADLDALSATSSLTIQGPRTDIADIVRAECIVSLENRTTSIYSTFDVVLYDADGNQVNSDIIVGTIPASTVRLPIYPLKHVPVDVQSVLIGVDNLAANHELIAASATPETVRVVGTQAAIDAIQSIPVEPINVSGLNAATTVEAELVLPEGVRVLDTEPILVNLDIRETTMEKEFTKLAIEVDGLDPNAEAPLECTLDLESVDLTISGRYSLVSILQRRDVKVSVDVTGLVAGTYTLPLSLIVRDEEATIELTTVLSAPEVTVTLSPAIP